MTSRAFSFLVLLLIISVLATRIECQSRGLKSFSVVALPKTGNTDLLKVNFTFVPWENLKAWKIKLTLDTAPIRAESSTSFLRALIGNSFVLQNSTVADVATQNKSKLVQVNFASSTKNLKLPNRFEIMTVNSTGAVLYQIFDNTGKVISVSNKTTSDFGDFYAQAIAPAKLVSDLRPDLKVNKTKFSFSLTLKFLEETTFFNLNFPSSTPLTNVTATGALVISSANRLTFTSLDKKNAAQQVTVVINAILSDATKAPTTFTLTTRTRNLTRVATFKVAYGVSSVLPKAVSTGVQAVFNFSLTSNSNIVAWKIAFQVTGTFLNASSPRAQLSRGPNNVYFLSNDNGEKLDKGAVRSVAFYVTKAAAKDTVDITTFDIMTVDADTTFYQRFAATGRTLGTFNTTSVFINTNATVNMTSLSDLVSFENTVNEVQALGGFYLTIVLTPRKAWDVWTINLPSSIKQVKPSTLYSVLNSEGSLSINSLQKTAANSTLRIFIEGQLTRPEDSPTSIPFRVNINGALFDTSISLTKRGFQNAAMSYVARNPKYAIDFTFTPWEDISSWAIRFVFAGEFQKIDTADFMVEWKNGGAYILTGAAKVFKGKSYTFTSLFQMPAGSAAKTAPTEFHILTTNTNGESFIQSFNNTGRMVIPKVNPAAFNSTIPTTNNSLPSQVVQNFNPAVNFTAGRPKFTLSFSHNDTWKGFFFRFINSDKSFITQVFGNCCTIVEDSTSTVAVFSTKDYPRGTIGIILQGTLKTTSPSGLGQTPSRLLLGTQIGAKQLSAFLELPVKEGNATTPAKRIVVQITLKGLKADFVKTKFVNALIKVLKIKAEQIRVISIDKRSVQAVEQDTSGTFAVNTEFSGNNAEAVVQNLTSMINNNDTALINNGIFATDIKVVDQGPDPTPIPSSDEGNSLSTLQIVGIALGCAAFVVIVIVVLAIVLKPKSHKRADQQPILY